jgi:hypothetical protein
VVHHLIKIEFIYKYIYMDEIFKNKYLKYKNKYLNLKKQLGCNLFNFYIYTTGIADWGMNPNLANFWVNTLQDIVIKHIPDVYKYIYIKHYDPIGSIEPSQNLPMNIKNFIQNDIQNLLIRKMEDPRIKENTYIMDYLPIDEINTFVNSPEFSSNFHNHIIIDMGHIFTYIINKPSYVLFNNKEYQLHSIYIGYFGNTIERPGEISDTWNLDIKLFSINRQNQLETFIDKFIQNKYIFNVNLPTDFFREILNNYKLKILFPLTKTVCGKIDDNFDNYYNNNQQKYYRKLIEQFNNEPLPQDQYILLLSDNFNKEYTKENLKC